MPATINDPIIAQSRGTIQEALNYARSAGALRWNDVEKYFNELWRLCKITGIDFSIATGQWNDETGSGKSVWWERNLNPCGLGLLESWPPGQITDNSIPYKTGEEAARAQIVHLYLYAKGLPLYEELEAYKYLDPRFNAVKQAGYLGIAHSISDLASKWASNPNYAVQIVKHMNAAFPNIDNASPGTGTTYKFGTIPHPNFQDRIISNNQTNAWDDLGQRVPIGVCQHSMVGSLVGTDGYFRLPQAGGNAGLTDYGIGGSADGANDGVIFRWNDPKGRRSGWANGAANGLEGDGPSFVRAYGVDGVNRNLVSIERSDGGNINTAVSKKQFNSIVALTAYWFDQVRVPWDKYPLNPGSGVVTHLLHNEIATKDCPFPAVYNRIVEIQDAVRGLLKAGQYGGSEAPVDPPTPIEPDHEAYPDGMNLELVTQLFGKLIRHNPDNTDTIFTFNPKGFISNAWLARGKKERMYPEADEWFVQFISSTDKKEYVQFKNGWVLAQLVPTEPWKWI